MIDGWDLGPVTEVRDHGVTLRPSDLPLEWSWTRSLLKHTHGRETLRIVDGRCTRPVTDKGRRQPWFLLSRGSVPSRMGPICGWS